MRGIDKKRTGENIKRLMRKSNMSTFDVQKALNLTSPTTLYVWMRGEYTPNAENLVILAQIFNCSLDELIVLEDE